MRIATGADLSIDSVARDARDSWAWKRLPFLSDLLLLRPRSIGKTWLFHGCMAVSAAHFALPPMEAGRF